MKTFRTIVEYALCALFFAAAWRVLHENNPSGGNVFCMTLPLILLIVFSWMEVSELKTRIENLEQRARLNKEGKEAGETKQSGTA